MSMIKTFKCFIATVTIVALTSIVSAAPNRAKRSLTPSWHLPCGDVLESETASLGNTEDDVKASLESIKLQHQLTMNDYLNRDYEYLYEAVRFSIQDHQYIPNWIPGKKDVNMLKNLSQQRPQTIANYLPKLHMDLQKFAVAFEELIEDESRPKFQEALLSTQSYLTMMLCEVESNIVVLPTLKLPLRVQRSIMSSTEREPVDVTRRLVRDWGILLKYRDYLHAWRRIFDY
ncbi:uncharacterized protein [Venturia canescens]|uniref:uncharacterized protein n=1 Tax=Venturia canescens TaxID=32260 RepID=UPI001C9BE9BD|nr:uncharacterized protein LOC122406454 [Venturia canescens]